MSDKLRRLARHPMRTAGWTAAGWWVWRNRHQMASLGSFVVSAPRRVLRHDYRDLAIEARVRSHLATDPTGRQIRDARLVGIEGGEAVIDGDPTSPDYAALVRVLTGHRGVGGVRQQMPTS